MKKILLCCSIILLTNTIIFAQTFISTTDASLIKTLNNKDIDENEKGKILDLFAKREIKLKPETILEALSICPPALVSKIMYLALMSGQYNKSLKENILSIAERRKNDPDFLVYLYRHISAPWEEPKELKNPKDRCIDDYFVFDSNFEEKVEETFRELLSPEFMLSSLKHNVEISALMGDSPESDYKYYKVLMSYLGDKNTSLKDKNLIMDKILSGTTLESSLVTPTIRESDLNIILNLLQSPDKNLVKKNKKLLSQLTHIPYDDKFDWNGWWQKNNSIFSIEETAYKNFSNIIEKKKWEEWGKKEDWNDCYLSIAQLAPCASNYQVDVKYRKALLYVFMDDSLPSKLRGCVLSAFKEGMRWSKEPLMPEDIKKTFLTLIANPTYKDNLSFPLVDRVLQDGFAFYIDEPDIRKAVVGILNRTDFNDNTKSLACTALGRSLKYKKQNATIILRFMETNWKKSKSKNNEGLNILVRPMAALMRLTQNKKAETIEDFVWDLTYWRKAVSSMPDDPPENAAEKATE